VAAPPNFLLLSAGRFAGLAEGLGECRRRRSFAPGRGLFAALTGAARDYAEHYHPGPEEPLLAHAARGLPFDRDRWRLVVGEALLFAADEIPEIPTAPETLCWLLAPGGGGRTRADFAPVEQALFGARDLCFGGGFYRPDNAGLNDRPDVARLADWLASVESASWSADDLAGLESVEEEDRGDELAFARDGLAALRGLYGRASGGGQVVVCERW
jgi:hypothetical protein